MSEAQSGPIYPADNVVCERASTGPAARPARPTRVKLFGEDLKWLAREDSNLQCLDQNQVCYHYTTRQNRAERGSAAGP